MGLILRLDSKFLKKEILKQVTSDDQMIKIYLNKYKTNTIY